MNVTFITACVAPEKGLWRKACTCSACVHAKCCQCGHEWHQRPDPLVCRCCGSPYVEWVNYEDWKKAHRT